MITPVNYNQSFTGKFFVPSNGENKNVKYMYNKVLDLVKEEHIPSVFRVDGIELTPAESKNKTIIEALKELGLKFINKEHS